MSDSAAFVESLSDEALYNQLKSHGIAAGPIVGTTRRLYRRKLIEILENQDKHDENPEVEESSFPPPNKSRWSHSTSTSPHLSYDAEEVSPRLNLSHSSSLYRRYDEEDEVKPRFSYLESHDSSRISSSSFLSKDSPTYSFSKPLLGTRDEDSFSRMRKTLTETRGRPELSTHHRWFSSSEENAARMARYRQEQAQKKLRLMMCGALVVVAVFVLFIIYNAWSDNDPYRQIEEEAKKLIEESNF